MMPEMNYIGEKPIDPLTLDIYPLKKSVSKFVLLSREKPDSKTQKAVFECIADGSKIKVKISNSKVAHELCVQTAHKPGMVALDSRPLKQYYNKQDYDKANEGWYFGAGFFYGSSTQQRLNIKLAKTAGNSQIIQIK